MTTMLTVGFGDISPSVYQEAIWVTFIQAFSCILLAYNISCIGNLLSEMRAKDIEKTQNLNISRRVAEENNIDEELHTKINNFVQQSDEINKKFNHETDKKFIERLPSHVKSELLKQSNKRIFKNLFFFDKLTFKTLFQLAEIIEVKIAYPEELIFSVGQEKNFMILREGEVGYFTNNPESKYDHWLIDKLAVKK